MKGLKLGQINRRQVEVLLDPSPRGSTPHELILQRLDLSLEFVHTEAYIAVAIQGHVDQHDGFFNALSQFLLRAPASCALKREYLLAI